MGKKARPFRNMKIGKDRQRLLQGLLAIVLLLAFFFFLFSGCDLIPEDMANIPDWSVTEPTPKPVDTDVDEAPIIDNPVLITEIVSSNASVLQTADAQMPDWIEFHNTGSSPVNLKDYGLSDNLNRPNKWVFPHVVLDPGAYLLVFASGRSDEQAIAAALAQGELHASFRLASGGEDLIFTNPAGQVLARLEIPEIPTDISWGLLDGSSNPTDPYYFFGEPTPGSANPDSGHINAAEAIPVPHSDLIVHEYITRQDREIGLCGGYPDWVEFYNAGPEPFSLLGCFLSDDPDNPEMWTFPDITLQPEDYLVVYLSGETLNYESDQPASLHATFRLGETDEMLVLSDPHGRRLLSQPLLNLPLNVAYGRDPVDRENWMYYPTPTPGRPNSTQGFAELEEAQMLYHRGIWINEAIALSAEIKAGRKESQADWIELFNATDQTIDLSGFGLSDRDDQPYLEKLDGLTIPAGGYATIEPSSFGIALAGETLQLTDPRGLRIDRFATGALAAGMSSGRGNHDGMEPADSRYFYQNPTPGSANTTTALAGHSLPPVITVMTAAQKQPVNGLYADEPVLIHLSSSQPDAVIHYTLDGSLPGSQSAVYMEPILVDQSTVIRSMALLNDHMPSSTRVRTILFTEAHDLPVVSILADHDDFFDPNTGLWTHFEAKIEQPAEIDFYEADGTPGVHFMAGINLHGSYSRTEKQKSLELKIRSMYGESQVTYPFFPENDVQTFKRLILRTSGQDWRFSKMRDVFMTEVIKQATEQETMDWRPCVVYINGRYFGLYYLREKVDQYYVAAHHGADPDNVDIIKGNRIVLSGDYASYGDLLQYVKDHDMRDPQHYAYVLSLIDEHSLMDFVITQTFFNNLDSGNKKFWRERKDGAEWRWVFFDLDWAMFPSTYTKNILQYDLLDPAGHGQQDIFDSTLQVKLMENPDFKKAFIERYAWYLNHVFTTERMLTILDEITGMISSEMPRQIERWGGPSSLDYWQIQVSELRRITSEKRDRVIVILQETFSLSQSSMQELFPEDFS